MPVVWRFSTAQGKNYCSLQSIDRLTTWRRKTTTTTTTTTPSKVFQWKQNLINPSLQHKAFHRSVLQWTKRKTRKNKTWRLIHLPSSGQNVCNSSRHFSSPLNPKTETPGTREQREGSKTLLFLLLLLLLLLEWNSSRVANFMSKAYPKKKTISAACLWNPKNSTKQQMSEELACLFSIQRDLSRTHGHISVVVLVLVVLVGEHLCSNACPEGPLLVVPVLREALWDPVCPVQLWVSTGSGRNFGGWWVWFLFFLLPSCKEKYFWIFSVKSLLWFVIIINVTLCKYGTGFRSLAFL